MIFKNPLPPQSNQIANIQSSLEVPIVTSSSTVVGVYITTINSNFKFTNNQRQAF